MSCTDHRVMRAANGGPAIIQILLAFPLSLWIYIVLTRPAAENGEVAAALLVFGSIFMWIWFKSFIIKIQDETLSYYSLFGKTKHIALKDIESAHIEKRPLVFGGIRIPEGAYYPNQLLIVPKKNVGIKPFAINLKIFKIKDIKQLLELLPVEKGKKGNRTWWGKDPF